MLIKRFTLILIVIICAFSMSACYDLGDGVENDEQYYDTYNCIKLIDSDGEYIEDYSMNEFYSNDTVNSFACPIEYGEMDKFCYMIIGIAKDVNIGEFALYFNSSSAQTLSVSFFLLNSGELPTKIKTKTNEISLEESDEPSDDKIIAKASISLSGQENSWSSIMIKQWKTGENTYSKQLAVNSNQYLVLRFDNNCCDLALRKFNKVKNQYEDVMAEYNEAKQLYNEKTLQYNSSSSESEKQELQQELVELNTRLQLATQQKNIVQPKYEQAVETYQEEKDIHLEEMAIRMTNILIYTKKGA